MEKVNKNIDDPQYLYNKGYIAGYAQAVKDCAENRISSGYEAQLIENLQLKKRTLERLHKLGIYDIPALVKMDVYTIWMLKGIGDRTRKEIAAALFAENILASDWLQFL